jgi:hypothetical protein
MDQLACSIAVGDRPGLDRDVPLASPPGIEPLDLRSQWFDHRIIAEVDVLACSRDLKRIEIPDIRNIIYSGCAAVVLCTFLPIRSRSAIPDEGRPSCSGFAHGRYSFSNIRYGSFR